MESPVVILGTERSGTSLLRTLLRAHSRLASPERGELQYFTAWWDDAEAVSSDADAAVLAERLLNESKLPHWGLEPDAVRDAMASAERSAVGPLRSLMELYCRNASKPRFVDKATGSIEQADRVLVHLPDASIVLIYRDPRDVFASTRNASWNAGAILAADEWAKNWCRVYGSALDAIDRDGRGSAIVNYERLARSPRQEIGYTLSFLGEQFEPACIDPSAAQRAQNSSFGRLSDGFDTSSIGRFESTLSTQDIETIASLTREVVDRLNTRYSKPPRAMVS
ncbi:MAG: sulfotransferase [Planctomycetota bacterium]